MLNIESLKNDSLVVKISSLFNLYQSSVKTLLDFGFNFNFDKLEFEGELNICDDIYKVYIYRKNKNTIVISIHNKKTDFSTFFEIFKNKDVVQKGMNIYPLLYFLENFYNKNLEISEKNKKKSFGEYVKNEKIVN